MKLRSSTKIAIGFVIIAGGGIYGYQYAMRRMIMSQHFASIVPGKVNIVGIDPGAGFKIIVANQMAQLVEASDKFEGKESSDAGATEGAIKKRVPIKELLDSLDGNLKALGEFIMKINDRDENDMWPPTRVIWTAERLTKALNGDKTEETALVHDLNVNLDGSPLPYVNRNSMENGIIIDYPVPVRVDMRGIVTTLIGRVQEPFKPDLLTTVERRLTDKQVDNDMIAGYYSEEAQNVIDGKSRKQDIKKAILARLAKSNADDLASAPEAILSKAHVVVNENFIEGASYKNYDTTNGKMNNLTVEMTDEGRKRLWQFSEDRVGTQLLLIVNGVPIAAPRISHELAQGEITITQLADETLVKEAVDALNKKQSHLHAGLATRPNPHT